MFTIRPSVERGHSQLDWLDSWHTFSFDRYYDPKFMHFGALRVINEDVIAGGGGFGTHPHRDMEIITYVISGQISHKDSMGNGSIISAGEIQKMSAGTGVWHSEYNASPETPVHLLQIWIVPDKSGLKPSYEQQRFELEPGAWKLLGSPNGDGLISIHQNVKLFALAALKDTQTFFEPQSQSEIWLQVVKGTCSIGDKRLDAGDGLAIRSDEQIEIVAKKDSELLLFEMLRS
jgi:hypothetical protein